MALQLVVKNEIRGKKLKDGECVKREDKKISLELCRMQTFHPQFPYPTKICRFMCCFLVSYAVNSSFHLSYLSNYVTLVHKTCKVKTMTAIDQKKMHAHE